VFLDTCGKSILDDGGINFQKYQKPATYILELKTYQGTPYNLKKVPEIQDYIISHPIMSAEEAFRQSLLCEPRDK
jgi:hypothetical protein